MNCSCSSDIKTKPTEFCLYCIHKHLSAALVLSEFITNKVKVIDYRAAAQINLAMLHLLDKVDDYEEEISVCHSLIFRILSKKSFIQDLEMLVKRFWDEINGVKHDIIESRAEQIDENDIRVAALKLSIVIELMKYERTYEDVNFSTAIGQLVNASWILQNVDEDLSDECRKAYHNIENHNISIEDIEKIRSSVFNKYIKYF